MQPVPKLHAYLHKAPTDLQEIIRQALIADTYVDDGGVGVGSKETLSNLQDEISKLLGKGGFQVKSWERSGQEGISKYLGMTWNRKDDHYLLKFRLNLHKKMRGIPSTEDLDSEFLQDKTAPITKKTILSVACQFYDPAGLAAPLMVPVRSLFSEICRDKTCSMLGALSAEILKTKDLSFPFQLVFNNSGQLYIFFDGCLQCYGACVYMFSSTSSLAPPKSWENSPTPPHNLRYLVPSLL